MGLYVAAAAGACRIGYASAEQHLAAVAVGDGLAEGEVAGGGGDFDAIAGRNAVEIKGCAYGQGLIVAEVQ